MNINSATLKQIREIRIQTDPLIPHPGTGNWLKSTPGMLRDLVEDARQARMGETTVDTPIEKATWPEATIFCFTRSMDAAIDQHAHLGAYQYCFDQLATDHLSSSFDEMVGGSMEIVTTDRHRQLAEDFREYIATAQHQIFLEEQYDELPIDTTGVPKAFWRSAISNTGSKTNTPDTDPQVTLNDY